MSLMLKRGIQMLVGAALLWVAILVMLPGVAEAQSTPASMMNDGSTATHIVVVRPGDSLWSISWERLGPNATLQQIDKEVDRIYALNRHRIGADPNLIFPGQKLLVPPVEPSAAGASGGASTERATKPAKKPAPKAAEAPRRDPVPESASKTPRNTEAGPVVLPDLPAKEVTPKVSEVAATEVSPLPVVSSARSAISAIVERTVAVARSLPEVRYDERQVLGLGFFAIAFGAALGLVVLVARPLRERRLAKRRTWQQGCGTNYMSFDPLAGLDNQPKPAKAGPEPERSTENVVSEAVGEEKDLDRVGTFVVARGKRADAQPAGAWPKATDAKDSTPEGPTPKRVTEHHDRDAGDARRAREGR